MAGVSAVSVLLSLVPALAFAHGVSDQAKQRMIDGGAFDFAWAGAEHILTGYDHLLFLLGALFVMSRFTEIVKFASAFTLGHTITLLGATMAGVEINHFAIDAFIALTVIYIGLRNLSSIQLPRWMSPPLLILVLAVGLIHGFGLSSGIQEMTLHGDPSIVGKLLAFNVGVECGQIAALTVMAAILNVWRGSPAWEPLKRLTNGGVVAAGLVLFAIQIQGLTSPPAPAPPPPRHSV